MLEASLHASLYQTSIRADDMEFFNSTRAWADCVLHKNQDAYRTRFIETAEFLSQRLDEGSKRSSELIKSLTSRLQS
jgi:prephenate dehydrogenase (NADP+)